MILLLAALTNIVGIVTFEREGLPFCFVSDPNGVNWRVAMSSGALPDIKIGDEISVDGVPEESIKKRMDASRLDVVAHRPDQVPSPRIATTGEIFEQVLPYGDTPWYGETITTEGLLRDINRRQASTQLLVGEGDCNIQVELPISIDTALPENLVLGSTVRVTGTLVFTSIENYEEGRFARVENIELLPISTESVQVVRRAPFWTATRLIHLVELVLFLLAVVSIWAVTLRRMVRKRTNELAESIRQREHTRIEADAARRERLRLAADLHDGFQQYLAGAMFRLKAAMNYLPKESENSRAQLLKVQEALQHTQSGLRATLWAMNEESEGPESLMELFRFASRRMPHWEGVVEFECTGEERDVARKFAATLLLVLQEAVANAIRHGEATRVVVNVAFSEKTLTITVRDNGKGFDVDEAQKMAGHYGIAGMRRRTADLGGEMTMESSPAGSILTFRIPC